MHFSLDFILIDHDSFTFLSFILNLQSYLRSSNIYCFLLVKCQTIICLCSISLKKRLKYSYITDRFGSYKSNNNNIKKVYIGLYKKRTKYNFRIKTDHKNYEFLHQERWKRWWKPMGHHESRWLPEVDSGFIKHDIVHI